MTSARLHRDIDGDAVTAAPKPSIENHASGIERGLVEIALPVYNEEAILASSVETLVSYLRAHCPHRFIVTIADNASTDDTWRIASSLSDDHKEVRAIRLTQKGKGRAVRAVWQASNAEVVAYMDVDLSTDLSAFNPLVAALFSGHSEMSIGTRLAKGAVVERGTRREMISRAYNSLLRIFMAAGFTDAQCGFKAARTQSVRPLLPKVHDEGWFFDAELLLLAEASNVPIFEVPVRWVDDPDTRVNVAGTARDDLKGMYRVAKRAVRGDFHIASPQQVQRSLIWQLVLFAIVGVVSTAIYTTIYLSLRNYMPALASNTVALTFTAIVNTAANRRFTFGIRGPGNRLRQQLEAGVAYLIALTISTGVLVFQQEFFPQEAQWLEVAAVFSGGVIATVFRFLLLREWVFNPKRLIPRSRKA